MEDLYIYVIFLVSPAMKKAKLEILLTTLCCKILLYQWGRHILATPDPSQMFNELKLGYVHTAFIKTWTFCTLDKILFYSDYFNMVADGKLQFK